MKKFIVPVLSICFFMSCSTDDTALNTVETTTTDSASDKNITEKSLGNPENPANTFDYIGALHIEMLDNYLNTCKEGEDADYVVRNVEAIARHNSKFISQNLNNGYTGLDVNDVEWTMENIDLPKDIMIKSGLGTGAKLLMENFIAMLDTYENTPFNEACNAIKAFEAGIIVNQNLTSSEARTILCSTSIARYALSYSDGRIRKWYKIKNAVTSSVFTMDIADALTISVTADVLTDNY